MTEIKVPFDWLSAAIKPEVYLAVRYIFMMDEFGSDEGPVLEILQDEFPNLSEEEIKRGIKPYRDLAQQWYDKGRTIIHGVILGWVLAAKKESK